MGTNGRIAVGKQ